MRYEGEGEREGGGREEEGGTKRWIKGGTERERCVACSASYSCCFVYLAICVLSWMLLGSITCLVLTTNPSYPPQWIMRLFLHLETGWLR